MAGRRSGNGRAFAIGAHPQDGDPLALEEDFDGPRGQPDVAFGAGETIGKAVVVWR